MNSRRICIIGNCIIIMKCTYFNIKLAMVIVSLFPKCILVRMSIVNEFVYRSFSNVGVTGSESGVRFGVRFGVKWAVKGQGDETVRRFCLRHEAGWDRIETKILRRKWDFFRRKSETYLTPGTSHAEYFTWFHFHFVKFLQNCIYKISILKILSEFN